MAGRGDPPPTGGTLLIPARSLAPSADPTMGREAPPDWASPSLWTPGDLICLCVGKITFDDPAAGRVTLEVSIWRNPLDPSRRYSAMVETF